MTVFFGNGRTRAGRVGTGIGYNGYAIRTSDAPWFVTGAEIRKTGESVLIASTQGHHSMEGRAIVRSGSLEHYKEEPEFPHHLEESPARTLTLYADFKYEGYSWGMANREHFFRAWLMSYMVWFGVALGSMAWLMIQYLSGGAWGVVTRRIFEASSRTLPFMAVLFLPIAFGVHDLYLWSHPDVVAKDEILQHREAYMNLSFFYARAVIYFVLWSLMAYLLSTWSRQQDDAPDDRLALRLQRLSGGGLVLYAITLFFASVDWVMSLDPHWFSTIYGILFMVPRPAGGRQPVAREGARVGDDVAAADLQLRSHADRDRRDDELREAGGGQSCLKRR